MGRMLALAGAICALFPPSAHAFTVKRTAAGRPVHWARPVVELRVEHGVPRDAAEMASEAWRGLPGVPDLVVVPGDPGRPGYDPGAANNRNGIYLLDEWTFEGDWLAVTVSSYDDATGRLLDTDVFLNGERGLEMFGEGEPSAQYDVASVLTHELGHVLGLGESDVPDATMYARLDRGLTHQRSIEVDDEDGAMAVYASAATTPTAMGCSATGAGGGSAGLGLLFLACLALIRRARI